MVASVYVDDETEQESIVKAGNACDIFWSFLLDDYDEEEKPQKTKPKRPDRKDKHDKPARSMKERLKFRKKILGDGQSSHSDAEKVMNYFLGSSESESDIEKAQQQLRRRKKKISFSESKAKSEDQDAVSLKVAGFGKEEVEREAPPTERRSWFSGTWFGDEPIPSKQLLSEALAQKAIKNQIDLNEDEDKDKGDGDTNEERHQIEEVRIVSVKKEPRESLDFMRWWKTKKTETTPDNEQTQTPVEQIKQREPVLTALDVQNSIIDDGGVSLGAQSNDFEISLTNSIEADHETNDCSDDHETNDGSDDHEGNDCSDDQDANECSDDHETNDCSEVAETNDCSEMAETIDFSEAAETNGFNEAAETKESHEEKEPETNAQLMSKTDHENEILVPSGKEHELKKDRWRQISSDDCASDADMKKPRERKNIDQASKIDRHQPLHEEGPFDEFSKVPRIEKDGYSSNAVREERKNSLPSSNIKPPPKPPQRILERMSAPRMQNLRRLRELERRPRHDVTLAVSDSEIPMNRLADSEVAMNILLGSGDEMDFRSANSDGSDSNNAVKRKWRYSSPLRDCKANSRIEMKRLASKQALRSRIVGRHREEDPLSRRVGEQSRRLRPMEDPRYRSVRRYSPVAFSERDEDFVDFTRSWNEPRAQYSVSRSGGCEYYDVTMVDEEDFSEDYDRRMPSLPASLKLELGARVARKQNEYMAAKWRVMARRNLSENVHKRGGLEIFSQPYDRWENPSISKAARSRVMHREGPRHPAFTELLEAGPAILEIGSLSIDSN